MKTISLFFVLLLGAQNSMNAQNVYIPDANFKSYLIYNTEINTNGDNQIQISEANVFTGRVDCPGRGIVSLKGIEYFVKATTLICANNLLTSLDVTKNVALGTLICYNNPIGTLDVSKNLALYYLSCSLNQLSSLDVSKNTALSTLLCQSNKLINLNIKNGQNNKITSFNASSNPNLNCILVDNVAYANANSNWIKDPKASYSTNCTLSVDEVEKSSVKILPNPANNFIIFKDAEKSSESFEYKTLDISGKLIKSGHSKFNEKIIIESLTPGSYIIEINSKTGQKTNFKLIKK